MIKIKEFLNFRNNDKMVNDWLEENQNLEIIDIKYSVGTFQESKSYDSEAMSGILIVYKEKVNSPNIPTTESGIL